MATGGFEVESEKTPILQKTDDQDDGDAGPGGDQTTEFEPGASSTPAPNGNQRQTTLNITPEYLSSLEVVGDSTAAEALVVVAKEFPFFEKNRIAALVENGRVKVALINEKGMIQKYHYLTTKIKGTDEYRINPEIKGNLKRALGKPRRETLEEQIKKMTVYINDNKKIAEDPSQSQIERNKARERAKMQIYNRTSMERELENLKKAKYGVIIPSESIELETFQKNDAVREERYQEKERQKEEQNEIASDENKSPEERERAKKNAEELEQEQNEILNEREREIEKLTLRDRLREKVKAIFKKYGFTVGAVFLAVGTTLGVVLSSLSNGLKTVSKGVGNGLKTLGKKIAPILPGIIGAVVSFVLRTAGNVVGFLGKHAWLLILAVAAFLFERVMKRRG